MSGRGMRLDQRPGLLPGTPKIADLADLWLAKGLAQLLDACSVPEGARRDLLESGIDPAALDAIRGSGPVAEQAQLDRLDASRLTLVFAELAVEARLNRVLRRHDPLEWKAIAHLATGEKFRLAPQLLGERGAAAMDAEFVPLVDELVEARNALAEAGEWPTGSPTRFGPSLACAMLGASARICSFLATLAGEDEGEIAGVALRAASALSKRADALSLFRFRDSPYYESSPADEVEFPPDLPEW